MSKIIAFGLASVLSFFLFAAMNLLIDSEARAVPVDEGFVFETGVNLNDLKPQVKDIRKTDPPEFKPLMQTPQVISEQPKPQSQPPLKIAKHSLDIKADYSLQPGNVKNTLANLNKSATGSGLAPTIRIEPHYPREAAQNGIEGYVTLQFDIDTKGSPTNIVIVESTPRGYFEKTSKNAVKKWKFDLDKEEGQPVAVYGQIVTLDFKLADET